MIVIVILELVSHVVLTYMVKKLPTYATMREVTHVGLDSIRVVMIFVGSVWTPKQVLNLFYAPLIVLEILVADSILPSFAPKLVNIFGSSTKRSPITFVVFQQFIFRIVGKYDWWKKNHTGEFFLHLFSVIGHIDQHLRGSMSMPNKLDLFLPGRFPDKINCFYQIIGQVKNCELPIVSPVCVIIVVLSTVFVTSRVSKPHVVTLIDKLDYGWNFFPNDPAVGRSKESMLKVNNFCIGLSMMSFDPKKGLSMSISRFGWVTLIFQTLFFDHLLKVFVVIWISASFVYVNTSVDFVKKWRFSWIVTLNEALR